jgi:hypothetical protein
MLQEIEIVKRLLGEICGRFDDSLAGLRECCFPYF